MNVLIYCIFEYPHPSGLESLKGLGDEPLSLIETDGLMAAVSRIVPPEVTPDLKRLLQYQKIIEWFHNNGAIIPMRYGCLVAEESEVIRILKKHGEEYKRLLRELEGCEEMGIRILGSEYRANQLKSEIENKPSSHPGQAYLASRKVLYDQEESLNKENRALSEAYREVFAGLFVKCKEEGPSILPTRRAVDNNRLLSLYFLVPKPLLNPFRRAFQRMPSKEGRKILLSGPWPPYNFVHSPKRHNEAFEFFRDYHDQPGQNQG